MVGSVFLAEGRLCPKCGRGHRRTTQDGNYIICSNPACDWKIKNVIKMR